MQQIMRDLPENRIRPTLPFLHSGVDYCGPFKIKQFGRGKQQLKSYVCLFICFATKAVHLELVSDLSTESFLAALKRYTARRGRCFSITSDNATNFIGAKRELKELKDLLCCQQHNESVAKYCAEEGIIWKFIPPRSPHFGGLWEASVKKAKFHLTRMLQGNTLNIEEFITLLHQVEGILNSRPITPVSSDPNDLEALTPSHFLIGRPIQSIPEPDVTETNVNRLTRWQYVTRLYQFFWKRWSTEYLHTLQEKNKWTKTYPNVKTGTLVILKEDHLPPLTWSLGRVQNIITGEDGRTRVVDVKTSKGIFRRAIHKICILPLTEDDEIVEGPSRAGGC